MRRIQTARSGRREFIKNLAALGTCALAERMPGLGVLPAYATTSDPNLRTPHESDGPGDDQLPYHTFIPLVAVGEAPQGAHGPSKLGLHTINSIGAADFVQDVYEDDAHVAIVKAVNEFGFLRLVKGCSPETLTIGRSTAVQGVSADGDPTQKAEWVMDQHMPRWAYEKDVVDFWEVLNENDPPSIAGHTWLAQFYIAAMSIAEENGYKLALFSYSTGVPEPEEWEAIAATGVFTRAGQGGHILALHEYAWPTMDYLWGVPFEGQPTYPDRGLLAMRYRYLYEDILIPSSQVIPLAITECGLDPMLRQPGQPTGDWMDRFVAEMTWYDTHLREDDYVLGAAMFTTGGGGTTWSDYDFTELLPDFQDYIVSLKNS